MEALKAYRQFVLYQVVDDPKRPGKTNKFPTNPQTMQRVDAHDSAQWMDYDSALGYATLYGDGWGVGFDVTANDPFWFLDLDDCLQPDGQWSPVAQELCGVFPSVMIEISTSGKGLHIIGSGEVPEHGCTCKSQGLEFYTEGRFVALTGTGLRGDASVNCTPVMPWLVDRYFKPTVKGSPEDWRDEPVDEWNGPDDDNVLIEKMLASRGGAGTVFGNVATFKQLWEDDVPALALAHPELNDVDPYDRSAADLALANRLAFWTGKHHSRIERLMRRSALVREKWDHHPTYLQKFTITAAVNRQVDVYCERKPKAVEPVFEAVVANTMCMEPEYTTGVQMLTHNQMVDLFKGCVYVRDLHRIFTPDGALLNAERFKAVYGGYSFGMDASNDRFVRNAWEAFTECQAIRFPKVCTDCFRPLIAPGSIIKEEDRTLLNTYIPIYTKRRHGDASRFVNHVYKLLPNGDDAIILLSYMAALVQNPGVKFQWAPVIQGVFGNGKTLLSRAVMFAVGRRYSHPPKASDLGNKHNAWVMRKLFGFVEEIYVTDRRDLLEEIKPLITDDTIEVQPKGIDQYMIDNFINLIFNTNHKDGIPITLDTRRYAPFFCAQQTRADKLRDFPGDYFPNLYQWMREEGYEIVNQFLRDYQIDARYNPAGDCQDAPRTSSTYEAVEISRGSVEQEIIEAIEEGRPGFAGGWISGHALDKLLVTLRAERKIPRNKRKDLLTTLGYQWHPGLPQGRVNNTLAVEGGKPKLYIKDGHAHRSLTGAAIVRCYCDVQGYPAMVASGEQIVDAAVKLV